MRSILVVSILLCSACADKTEISHYETPDGFSSLYIIDGRYIFTSSFVDLVEARDWIETYAVQQSFDSKGCNILHPLVVPGSLDGACESLRFNVERSADTFIFTNCPEDITKCQSITINKQGEVIQFQFAPHIKESAAYEHVAGPVLKMTSLD